MQDLARILHDLASSFLLGNRRLYATGLLLASAKSTPLKLCRKYNKKKATGCCFFLLMKYSSPVVLSTLTQILPQYPQVKGGSTFPSCMKDQQVLVCSHRHDYSRLLTRLIGQIFPTFLYHLSRLQIVVCLHNHIGVLEFKKEYSYVSCTCELIQCLNFIVVSLKTDVSAHYEHVNSN